MYPPVVDHQKNQGDEQRTLLKQIMSEKQAMAFSQNFTEGKPLDYGKHRRLRSGQVNTKHQR